jgi:hypothetical protein
MTSRFCNCTDCCAVTENGPTFRDLLDQALALGQIQWVVEGDVYRGRGAGWFVTLTGDFGEAVFVTRENRLVLDRPQIERALATATTDKK